MGKITERLKAWNERRKNNPTFKEKLKWWNENRKIKKTIKEGPSKREVVKLTQEEEARIMEEILPKESIEIIKEQTSPKYVKNKLIEAQKNLENEIKKLDWEIENADELKTDKLKEKKENLLKVAFSVDKKIKDLEFKEKNL